jgi:hypothetical protein
MATLTKSFVFNISIQPLSIQKRHNKLNNHSDQLRLQKFKFQHSKLEEQMLTNAALWESLYDREIVHIVVDTA